MHQADFHVLARDLLHERETKLAGRIASEQGRLQELRQQLRDEAREPSSSQMRLGACRFSDSEKVDFEALYASEMWTRDRIARLRAKCSQPIEQPIDPTKATLDSMEVPPEDIRRAALAWAKWVAHHRDFFKASVFRMTVNGAVRHFRFIFAVQKPVRVCFFRGVAPGGRRTLFRCSHSQPCLGTDVGPLFQRGYAAVRVQRRGDVSRLLACACLG